MDKKIFADYFAGRLSSEQEEKVKIFLAEHSDNKEVSDILEEIYEASSDEMEEAVVDDMFSTVARRLRLDNPSGKRSPAFRRSRLWRAMAISAAGLAAAFLVLPMVFKAGERRVERERDAVVWLEKTVPAGSTDSLVLADGSRIYLEGGTHIVYPSAFYGSDRTVFVSGEIFAEIARDTSRPFIVKAGDVKVKVLGTSFNLRAYDALRCVETILLEGSVNLELTTPSGEQTARMRPGSIAQYDRKTGQLTVSNMDISARTGFKKGSGLYYYDISMQDIATDLSRVFGKKIVVMDEKLAESRYFAIFTNNESLDDILSAISSDGKMVVSERDGTIYLRSI